MAIIQEPRRHRGWRRLARIPLLLAAMTLLAVLLPATALAQGGGGGGGTGGGGTGGGSEQGELYGDLYHILRHPVTGQPILQKRWIEYPGDLFDWGYCPIPVDVTGAEIPFADSSCDVHPDYLALVVEVDYFGRLSGGRTREANSRMHFDEMIVSIQAAERVVLDPAGRLNLGTDCTEAGCASWKVIDSPQQNLAMYRRLLKYGHFQTDPLEVDADFHGDPALPTQYHPALRPEDWPKFEGVLKALLPRATSGECFTGDTFNTACAQAQPLDVEDFVRAASFLGGAADKFGRITPDLVQYLNAILKITSATETTVATLNTVPALIRDEAGNISDAPDGLPFPANQRFVDFTPASYYRNDRFNVTMPALQLTQPGIYAVNPAVSMLEYLLVANGTAAPATNMPAFVSNGNDALRVAEFIHNYEVPADLWIADAPTTTTVTPVTVPYSIESQTLTLTATVSNTTPVNGGIVHFRVEAADGTDIGIPVLSLDVLDGIATAAYVLPGGTEVQVLTITASYIGTNGFAPSVGTATLTIEAPAIPELTVANASALEGTATPGTLNFVLTLSGAYHEPVTVQYTTQPYTATAPADYVGALGTATFAPGVKTVTVPVTLVADAVAEPNETMTLILSAPVNAVLIRAAATGQIVNDDGDMDVGPEPLLDFNQDGFADLVWRHATTGRIGLWFMSGLTELYGVVTTPSEAPLAMELRAVGDFSGDWKPDMIFQDATDGTLTAWTFDGAVRTGELPITTLGGGSAEPALEWKIMAAADMDNDGALDLLWQNMTTGDLRIWHMNGTLQLDSEPISLGVGVSGWRLVGAADMNGDGQTDLVWRNPVLGGLAAWLMADNTVLRTVWLSPSSVTDPLWRIAAVRDMNGDGFADLVWQHDGDSRLAVWLMNGLTMTATPGIVGDTLTDFDWKIVGAR